MMTLHEYKGVDSYSNRVALVVHDGNNYGIIYKVDDTEEYRTFSEKSMHYIEDAAENWVIGIINPKDLKIT